MSFSRPSQKRIAKYDIAIGSYRVATMSGNFAEQGLTLPMRH